MVRVHFAFLKSIFYYIIIPLKSFYIMLIYVCLLIYVCFCIGVKFFFGKQYF